MTDLTGQTFDGFEILSKLGQGGMGAVYKARQVSLNRFVALKVMSNALAEDQEFIERFKREATTAAQFKHPNIVQVHAAGESSGTHYMAMEFVEGRTLREHIRSHGRLDPQEAIAITLHVAEGLKYAWNKSRMIHRDIKPDNVFLSQSGEVLVGDLGLAKSAGSGSTELTASGAMMGSPHYISPEQAIAAKDIDFRSDIYSLGCTLFHMLTGRTAYEGDSSMVLIMKHVNEPAPDIFEAMPDCPRKLGVMLGRMMAKNRDDRPSSYDELITGLWEANENLSGDTEIGRPPATQSLTPTAVRQVAAVPTVASAPGLVIGNRRLVTGGAVGAVALLLAGLFLWSPWKNGTNEQQRHEDAKQGSESRLQAESVSGQPAKAGTPNAASPADEVAWQNAINLLPLIDPAKDAVAGTWTIEKGELVVENDEPARIEIPYRPPEQYDYLIEFTQLSKKPYGGCQQLFKAGCSFTWVFFGTEDPKWFGFEIVGGKSMRQNNPTKTKLIPIETGRKYVSLVEVRNDGVRGYLDGKPIVTWKTDYSDLSSTLYWKLRDSSLLGVGSQSRKVFHRIEVREVTGKGTFTRGAPSGISTTPPLQHSISSAASSSAALKQLGNVFTNSVGAEMVYIPPGEFMLGSTKEEQAWAVATNTAKEEDVKCEGEAPRKATIKQGFWMGRTEVTVGQWKQFVKETGYVTNGERKGESSVYQGQRKPYMPMKGKNWRDPNFGFEVRDDHPVCCVSWNDAKAFCEWQAEREQRAARLPHGYAVRLPTEAEWEYACRAGRQTKYWWGDSKEDGSGRLNWTGKDDGFEFVAPVDSFGARGRNRFGLADMLGNIWEWCLDGYDATQAHKECYMGNPDQRVLRGGSFDGGPAHSRCARRYSNYPATSRSQYGFRVVVAVEVSNAGTPTPSTSPSAATRVSALTTNPTVGNVFTNAVGAEMVYIPPGEFMLGSTKEEQAWAVANGAKAEEVKSEGEAPRKTRIKGGFWLGRTEVTVGQWKQFVKETGYVTDAEKKGESNVQQGPNKPSGLMKGKNWRDPNFGFEPRDDHPVCCVSWNDAVTFCEWLNGREQRAGRLPHGFVVRLPREAEWECACRAGAQTMFWWGDAMERSTGRLNRAGKDDEFEFVAPVDSFGARGRNRFGLADMLGNVTEWCLDKYDSIQAHEELWTGNTSMYVLRGGAFHNKSWAYRCASRSGAGRSASFSFGGFRVCVGVDVSNARSSTSSTPSPTAAPKEGGILAPAETRVTALTTNPKVGEVYTLPVGSNVTMELMGIPPGEFMLGSTKEEREWAIATSRTNDETFNREGEAPRKAMLKAGGWMGRTEVTVRQWKQFVRATGYKTESEKSGYVDFAPIAENRWGQVNGLSWRDPGFGSPPTDDHPVCCVNWNDAKAFCEWLTEQERKAGRLPAGCVIRLPTEAEWEYACRAGTQAKFWWGDSDEDGKSRLNWFGLADGFEFASPVDHYGALGRNKFGLADMLGNLYEWCLDEFDDREAHEECYKGRPRTRAIRGGSFGRDSGGVRCANRNGKILAASDGRLGFRVYCGVDVLGTTTPTALTSPVVAPKESGILAPPETRVAALTTNPKVGEVYTLPLGSNVTMELMGIPPGEFMMGSTKEEQEWAVLNGTTKGIAKLEGEAPRRVTLQQGVWMGRTEVTVLQWKQFVAATSHVTVAEKTGGANVWLGAGKPPVLTKGACWRNPGLGVEIRDNHPVSSISFNDAITFCEWLTDCGRKAGVLPANMVLRLPMQAEWEYACRAGTQTRFWWGDSTGDGKGRLNWAGKEDGFELVAPVNSFGARGLSRFGLADMLGNVSEMCFDKSDELQNQRALQNPNSGRKALRGGSFVHKPGSCRSAWRVGSGPDTDTDNTHGFRVVVGPVR